MENGDRSLLDAYRAGGVDECSRLIGEMGEGAATSVLQLLEDWSRQRFSQGDSLEGSADELRDACREVAFLMDLDAGNDRWSGYYYSMLAWRDADWVKRREAQEDLKRTKTWASKQWHERVLGVSLKCISVGVELGDIALQMEALDDSAWSAFMMGEVSQSTLLAVRLLPLAQMLNDNGAQYRACIILREGAYTLGDYKAALHAAERLLSLRGRRGMEFADKRWGHHESKRDRIIVAISKLEGD